METFTRGCGVGERRMDKGDTTTIMEPNTKAISLMVVKKDSESLLLQTGQK